MSQEITLQQAAERAHQIEVICALAEDYPGMMTDSESGAIIGLLKRLSGEVCVFLSDEQERRTLISNEKNAEGYTMCNNIRPDATAAALTTLMHALIDISVIADRAHKHATSETEYAGAFVPHSLAVMQFSADMALNEAKTILITDCENGGVMRDDRFNSLKQEFSGVSDDASDALSAISELIRASFFLIGTKEYKSTGIDVLNIAADYDDFVTEAVLRKTTDGD